MISRLYNVEFVAYLHDSALFTAYDSQSVNVQTPVGWLTMAYGGLVTM